MSGEWIRTAVENLLQLPCDGDSRSLWCSLHDGEIVSIESNLLERTLKLLCDVDYVRCFHKLPEGLLFELMFEEVGLVCVFQHVSWPGKGDLAEGESYDEANRRYWQKCRWESLPWNEFETAVSRERDCKFEISDAELYHSADGSIALRLSGQLDHREYRELFVTAARLKISGSDGRRFLLEEFEEMGGLYWDNFGSKNKSAKESKGQDG